MATSCGRPQLCGARNRPAGKGDRRALAPSHDLTGTTDDAAHSIRAAGPSQACGETVLALMPLPETGDAFVVGDQLAAERGRRGNQQAVGRVAVVQMVQPVGRGTA